MILVDANLLIYANERTTVPHERARAWLDDRLNGDAPVGLPWASLLAFVRIVTHPRMFERPCSVGEAWTAATRSTLVSDAHVAALAIEHGLTLCSTDGDFARFSGLRWENPLA